MSYTGKNPKFNSVVLPDMGNEAIANAPDFAHRVINRFGKLVLRDDDGNETPIGSGEGSANGNYIKNPSASVDTTGLLANGSITIERDTSSNVPNPNTTGTAFKLTSSENGAYGYRRFKLNPTDLNRRLGWTLAYNANAASRWKIEVYTSSTDGSGYAKLGLSTNDTDGNTLLAEGVGKIEPVAAYTTDDRAFIELRYVHVGTSSDTLYISDDDTRSQDLVIGPIITKPESFTPQWVSSRLTVGGTGASNTGFRWREGQFLCGVFGGNTGSTGGGTSGVLTLGLPSGLTIDDSFVSDLDDSFVFGSAHFRDTVNNVHVPVQIKCNSFRTALTFLYIATASSNFQATNVGANAGFGGYFKVPIKEWRDTGNAPYLNTVKQSPVKAGTIVPFAGSSAPNGWMICDGSAISQATYHDLYAAIGTTWNTATNPTTGSAYSAPSAGQFRIPDLRGMFMRGVGTPSGLGAVTLAGYQADMVGPHTHEAQAYQSSTAFGVNQLGRINNAAGSSNNLTILPNTGTETRPRNVGVNYIIKLWNDGIDTIGLGMASSTEAGLLQYYNTGSSTGTWDGVTTSPSITAFFTRIGNSVTMTIGAGNITLTKNATVGALIVLALVPTWARPSSDVNVAMFGAINGTSSALYCRIKTNGNVEIYTNTFTSIAGGTTNCGLHSSVSSSWLVV